MKNYIVIIGLFLSAVSLAQVGVETQTVRGDGIMDFKYPQPTGATKGILLPKLSSTTAADVPTEGGALAFNVATQQVEVFSNEDETWKALTPAATGIPSDVTRTGFAEVADNGTVVEAGTLPTERPNGVLVLDSTDHALILPTVATAQDLPQVNANSAGMICYIEEDKTMAVFNGEVWSFWN